MKNVLIALDDNLGAKKVAEKGFILAKRMGSDVTLLHVISNPEDYSTQNHICIRGFAGNLDTSEETDEKETGTIHFSQEFLDKSKLHLGDKNIHTLIKEGDPVEAILNAAKEIGADIIVMGTHRMKRQKNALIGSVTEKILHNTSIPLFIIPTKKIKDTR